MTSAPTVRVVTRLEELEELRPVWTALQWHPNAEFDFYSLIVRARPEVKSPCVLVLFVDGKPEALLAGRIEETKETFNLGYVPLARVRVRRVSFVYGGNLGRIGPVEARLLVDAIIRLLRDEKLDFAFFSHLRAGDALLQAARQNRPLWLRDFNREPSLHYRMSVPDSISQFLARFKRRRHFGKLQRWLDNDYPNQVSMRRYAQAEDIASFARDADAVASKTYHRKLDAGFKNDEEHRRRLELAARGNRFRGYILYIQDEPRAYWCGTLFKDVFHLAYTGYDPDFRKYELGTVLFLRMVEDICGSEIKALDFSFGDAFYKQRFADQNWTEESVCLYAPTWSGVTINVLRTLTTQTNRYAKYVLETVRVTERLKSWWRRRLGRQSQRETTLGDGCGRGLESPSTRVAKLP